MCNVYRLGRASADVARMFDAAFESGNAGEEVYPGYPGYVVSDGVMRTKAWGFPLALKSQKTGKLLKPKPVNNARADKLHTPFWRASFETRRCIIPVSSYAEAEGPKGPMTRTWLSSPETEVMAVAGLWRFSDEWGAVYSMIMTDASPAVQGVHTRMPVILNRDHLGTWWHGSARAAFELCQPYAGDLVVARTADPWVLR